MKTRVLNELNEKRERADRKIWRTVLGFVGLVLLTIGLLYLDHILNS